MKQREISQQVVFTAVLILFSIEFLTAGIIFWLDINPLLAIGTARGLEIASLLFILARWGNGLESIGLSRNDLAPGLKKGFAWSAVFWLSAMLLLAVLYFSGRNIMKLFLSPVEKSTLSIFLLFLVGGLISPVAEEIFFRGIIYGWLRRWGAVTAIMGSTALFAMAHLLTSGVTAIQVIGGLVFAISYEMEKNLMVPITIHVLGNMAIFSLSILSAP
jgi:membrane protease YdiL (CAAX protease family)